jgi:acetylglutamate kinase
MDRIVLKVGGSELGDLGQSDGGFVGGLIEALKALWKTHAVTLVHGGGKAIAQLQARLGLEARFVDGLRVTDDASLDVAEMVLSGLVNKRLVACLVSGGVPAVGLSGVDNGTLRVVKMNHPSGDLGWVGKVVEACAGEVEALMDRGVTPVLSPISLGLDGRTYNVNADHAACALAHAVGASELVFVSNVPGVLVGGESGECVPALTQAQVDALVESGEIRGGMVPKVRSALAALDRGVTQVRITNLDGLCVGGGTCFLGKT